MNQNQTSPQKRIKWCLDVAFVLVFLCMIFVPFLKLDTAETIDSTLENRSMTKWPGLDLRENITNGTVIMWKIE